ncbi:hypothetical protein J5N97_014973 [Dioscorea zingiberensis]|uniref:RING-type E3 ubiquitin transferase n=1 Tax=Dioscorea zingiberensis TaxID=325984 RepID=A0A9D5CV41_9LILI|nr:hypothetical protein J5N97_014973 [Dioscorea zingiberensis]
MELLSPTSPPRPAADRFAETPPRASLLSALIPTVASPSLGTGDGSERRVYVAVGKSPEKTAALLRWTFRHFRCKEVWLLHVHQPSLTIPTLLGRLPVSQANDGLVSAYRKVEREGTKRALLSYLTICYRDQVQGKIVMTEAGQIADGILDVVAKHKIHNLVMGETPDNCFKVKGRSSLTTYIAKKAPPFCEIWFVGKGKVVWTRESNELNKSQLIDFSSDESVIGKRFKPSSLQSLLSDANHQEFRCSFLTTGDLVEARNMVSDELHDLEMVPSPSISTTLDSANPCDSRNSTSFTGASSFFTSPVDGKSLSPFSIQELDMEVWPNHRKELMMDIEKSKKEASIEVAKRKELESEMAEAFYRDTVFEAAHNRETKLRHDFDDQLSATKQQQQVLVHQSNETMAELENAMRNVMLLSQYAQEVDQQRDKAAEQLGLIQASIMALNLEKQNVQEQREEAIRNLEKCRYKTHSRFPRRKRVVDFGVDPFMEFSFSDLQAATCEFSECFKLGQGGYGSVVYKGEILSRTVAIKKLHPHNVYGPSEFQQEVYVLSKLRHPHLVTLIGVCPEALALVYEYLPNGTLHDHLFCRASMTPLTWRVRAAIAAQISSALLFLHSSKPEKIIHGDLKPKNIFLDSDFNCKIGDFRICRLVPEETMSSPFFYRITEPQGLFPYADPECQNTGDLTLKCDVYAFGIIILQLLTGRPPLGLVSEVRRAMSTNTLPCLLDQTAGEWPISKATKLAEFGLKFTEMNSRDRPELTPEIVKELEELHSMEARPVPSFFLCPILQEIMHDPQAAADGFTYEGSAMRGWLRNGRKTSPMTNLQLEDLNLTPNHTLRLVIQDWLCQS